MWLYPACSASIGNETSERHYNGDNPIQNLHLGRIIVGYTFGNHVLPVVVKLNFLSDDIPLKMKLLNIVIP